MKEPKINFNIGNSESKRIITRELKISQNVFIYDENVIQISNIAKMSIADAMAESYQMAHFIMVFVGVICLLTLNWILILIGLAVGALGAWLIYKTYQRNQELGEYLILSLNSGEKISLYSKDHDFTIEIMDVIINCINSSKEYQVVNMDNCKIEACQFGENNVLRSGR